MNTECRYLDQENLGCRLIDEENRMPQLTPECKCADCIVALYKARARTGGL
ncbi:MAG: hypothetical protein GXP47_12900 [Acidobacteria bacterium]|nr:hypothetical protein [Acidobacteriota bacterium]